MRSKYVYTVCWLGTVAPLATFTVKYEAQDWAEAFGEKHGWRMESLVRFRYAHPDRGEPRHAVKCPWEES